MKLTLRIITFLCWASVTTLGIVNLLYDKLDNLRPGRAILFFLAMLIVFVFIVEIWNAKPMNDNYKEPKR